MSKSSLFFCLSYYFFLVLCVLYPSIPLIGGVTVRHALSIVMLGLCIFNGVRLDWFVKAYGIFLVFYFIADAITGYADSALRTLLGTYLAGLVLYSSTKLMVIKYKKLSAISLLLLFIFILDAIVTIGQYYMIPQFVFMPQLMGIDLGDDFMHLFDLSTDVTMQTVLAGLFGTVYNGYVLSAAVVLAWYPFKQRYMFVNLITWLICLLASFYAQERSGFFFAILSSFFLLYYKYKSNRGWNRLFIFILFIIIIIYAASVLDVVTTTGRYQKGVESGSREGLIDAGLQFLYSHFWGGINLYKSTHQLMPHNLFINMFLAGGYIGGFILLFIVCKQIYIILRFLIRTHYSDNWLPILFGLMYLVFTGNSLFHNMSIVYGDPLFFVFWGVCACYVETNRSKHPIYSRSKYKTYITKSL